MPGRCRRRDPGGGQNHRRPSSRTSDRITRRHRGERTWEEQSNRGRGSAPSGGHRSARGRPWRIPAASPLQPSTRCPVGVRRDAVELRPDRGVDDGKLHVPAAALVKTSRKVRLDELPVSKRDRARFLQGRMPRYASVALLTLPVGVIVALRSSRNARSGPIDDVVSAAAEMPRLHSLIVSWRGKVLVERYYNGARASRSANIKSASKSVISASLALQSIGRCSAASGNQSGRFSRARRAVRRGETRNHDRGSPDDASRARRHEQSQLRRVGAEPKLGALRLDAGLSSRPASKWSTAPAARTCFPRS